jgi:hypothetical protein
MGTIHTRNSHASVSVRARRDRRVFDDPHVYVAGGEVVKEMTIAVAATVLLAGLGLLLPATNAAAITLVPGDVLILSPWLHRIDPISGEEETIAGEGAYGWRQTAIGRSGLYIADGDTDISRVDPETGAVQPVVTGLSSFRNLEVAPSGVIYVTQTENPGTSSVTSRLLAIDPQTGGTSVALENTETGGPIPGGELLAVSFFANGHAVLAVRVGGYGGPCSIYLANLATGLVVPLASGPLLNLGYPAAIVVGPDDRIFAAVIWADVTETYARFIEIDALTGAETSLRNMHTDSITDLEVSPDGNTLYTGGFVARIYGNFFARIDLFPTPGIEYLGPQGIGFTPDLAVFQPVPVPALRSRSLPALALVLAGAALFGLRRRAGKR